MKRSPVNGEPPVGSPYTGLITSHKNPLLSGVAKFNQHLARSWDIPLLGFGDLSQISKGPLLISVKLSDLFPEEVAEVRELSKFLRERSVAHDLYFHTFDHLDLEKEMLKDARQVFCAHDELVEKLQPYGSRLVSSFCPGLLDRPNSHFEGQLNFFSFGMAHKIQLWMHRNLMDVLDRLDADYALWLSSAFHEKANFSDFDSVSRSLVDIYGKRLRFLGFLSDESVNFFLGRCNAFIAFFEKGVRANNTSVFAAMERGCPIVTNLDGLSPKWLRHGVNIIDVSKLENADLQPERLKQIGLQGAEDVGRFASWNGLLEQFRVETCKV